MVGLVFRGRNTPVSRHALRISMIYPYYPAILRLQKTLMLLFFFASSRDELVDILCCFVEFPSDRLTSFEGMEDQFQPRIQGL